MSNSKYIPSLDGLRAVSIGLVFAGHGGLDNIVPTAFGVTIFFFISGYLITTLFFREFAAADSINLKNFYLRRVFRLGPPLAVALALAIFLNQIGYLGGESGVMVNLSQLLSFYNYYRIYTGEAGISGTGVVWSLSVEEHFYLIFPIFFIFYLRGRIGLSAFVALLLAFPVWRLIRLFVFDWSQQDIYFASETRMDTILWGAFLAMLQQRGALERAPGGWKAYAIIFGAVALMLAEFVFLRNDVYRDTIRWTTQGVLLMPLVFYATNRSDMLIFRPLQWGWVCWIGVWSYSLYLVHNTIIYASKENGLLEYSFALHFIGCLVVSLLCAAAIHRWIETPFRRMRTRLHAEKG